MERPRLEIIEECGYTATKNLTLPNGKTVRLPAYLTKIRKDFELDLIIEGYANNEFPKNFFGGVFFEIPTASKIISRKEKISASTLRRYLSGSDEYLNFKDSVLVLVDPMTEVLYYKLSNLREAYGKISDLPTEIKEFLNSEQPTQDYYKVWRKIYSDGKVSKVVNWYLKYQSSLEADAILPPVPFLRPEGGLKMLEIALEVNDRNQKLSEANGLDPAIYFLLSSSLFKYDRNKESSDEILRGIIDFAEDIEYTTFVFLKIIGYNELMKGDDLMARRRVRDFLRALGIRCKINKSVLFLLDADSFGYVNVINGVDGFVEPLDMQVELVKRRSSKTPPARYGKIYLPEEMRYISYEEFVDRWKSNGRKIPNHTQFSRKIENLDFENIDSSTWNRIRRIALIDSRNYEMAEIHDAIIKGSTRGIVDKILRSGNKNYLDLIE
ncbi:hypothetical protein DRP04_09120 [Archaeoglobales archaeon]|nr:MAG: hypothetical protein DRP04_09120 [Archaeoglobales archaeon]